MSHGPDFWSFIPFLLSSSPVKKINWMRIAETLISAVIISLFVSYMVIQEMQVELKFIWKTIERHEYEINLIRNSK